MQKKRKLTASFGDIPAERENLKRSWRSGEHSDWFLTLGGQEYGIHKILVATGDRASAFLAASFRQHCGTEERTDLTDLIPRPCWAHFEALLDYVYEEKICLTADNWGAFTKMADVLQIKSLYELCVSVGAELIARDTAPKMVADTVELQLSGEIRDDVVHIAVDEMAPRFSSYSPKDLAALPVQVFKALLQRDDLEIATEDDVFKFLRQVGGMLGPAEMSQLWRCCRLHHMSPDCILEVARVGEIPKEHVVWALTQSRPLGPRAAPAPAWAEGLGDSLSPRGREITFLVPNPTVYASKRFVRSAAHQLCDRCKWRLLIFPLGTESTGSPKQVAAFVELVPEPSVDPGWQYHKVKYTITLVNWSDEDKNVTKEHTFDFSASEVDNGWHRGWVTPDAMTTAQGWLNESGELKFRARCCVREASLSTPGD